MFINSVVEFVGKAAHDSGKDDTLYLIAGNFGCLRDLCYEKRRKDMRMIHPGQKTGSATLKPFSFYGPACESMDYMPGPL